LIVVDMRYSSRMASQSSPSHGHYAWLVSLPSLYVLLVVFTMIQSARVDGGTYYRIFGVNPVAMAVGMVSEGPLFFSVLFVFGTFWWFYIGQIGRKSLEGHGTRSSSAFGAVVSTLTAFFGIGLTQSTFSTENGALRVGAILQYACVGTLCLGAIATAVLSTISVFRRNKPL
jgi:hypothetical protein